MPGSSLNLQGFGLKSSDVAAIQAIIETNYIKYTAGVVAGFINADGSVTSAVDESWSVGTVYTAGTTKAQISVLTALAHTLQGTENQLIITPGAGDILILSTPQDLGPTSIVTFGGIVGRADAAGEAAGNRGEFKESVIAIGNQVALVTTTAKTLTSLTLGAGEWDLVGLIVFNGDATTTVTVTSAGIGAATNTLPGAQGLQTIPRTGTVPATNVQLCSPTVRVALAVETTLYLIAWCVFGVAAMNVYGHLQARRV